MEQSNIKVVDKRNDFKLLMWLDAKLANSLNVGDSIMPDGTGFSFIIIDKLLVKEPGNENYSIQLNVVEYETFLEKIKRILFGVKSYGYWSYIQNTELYSHQF